MPEETTAPETAASEVLEPSEARPEDIFESQTGGGLPLEGYDSLNRSSGEREAERVERRGNRALTRAKTRTAKHPETLRRQARSRSLLLSSTLSVNVV